MALLDNGAPRGSPPAALPGLDGLDETLVGNTVRCINAIHRDRSLEFARQVGSAILKAFFRNCSDLYHTLSSKHVSFRSLAACPDLEMSYSTLYRYTAIEIQIRRMPLEVAMALSVTHHGVLLAVRDMNHKVRLARRAVEAQWSSRQLREMVRKEREQRPRTGRPPLPPVVKATRGLSRALAIIEDLEDAPELPQEQAQALLEDLTRVRERIDEVWDQVSRRATR